MSRPRFVFEDVHLFLSVLPNGDETLLAVPITRNIAQPLVAADEGKYREYEEMGQQIADDTGLVVQAVAFKKVGVRRVFAPTAGKQAHDLKQLLVGAPKETTDELLRMTKKDSA